MRGAVCSSYRPIITCCLSLRPHAVEDNVAFSAAGTTLCSTRIRSRPLETIVDCAFCVRRILDARGLRGYDVRDQDSQLTELIF